MSFDKIHIAKQLRHKLKKYHLKKNEKMSKLEFQVNFLLNRFIFSYPQSVEQVPGGNRSFGGGSDPSLLL